MEQDNKFVSEIKTSELESVEEQMDDDSDKVADAMQARESYFTREPEWFGGGRIY